MKFTGDTTGQTPESVDESRVGPGWHLATLVDVSEDGKDGKMLTTWRCDSPPWVGATIKESYNNPALASTEAEMSGQQRRLNIWLRRMGLMTDADVGKRVDYDPTKAVGQQRVLEVIEDSYQDRDGKPRTANKIKYAGIWQIDRPEIPVADRIRLGLPLLPGQVAPSACQPPHQPAKKGQAATPAAPAFDPSEV